MHVPRRLYKTKEHPPYQIVEEGDPRAAFLLCPQNALMTDAEAKALGITDYLARYDAGQAERHSAAEAKMVEPGEVENKAVDPAATKASEEDDAEDEPVRGVIMPPESRRATRGR